MTIIIKQLKDINHIYLFDQTMRPLFIDIVSTRKTKTHVKKLIKNHDVTNLEFVSEIDFD